jgi:hypothetical protein
MDGGQETLRGGSSRLLTRLLAASVLLAFPAAAQLDSAVGWREVHRAGDFVVEETETGDAAIHFRASRVLRVAPAAVEAVLRDVSGLGRLSADILA